MNTKLSINNGKMMVFRLFGMIFIIAWGHDYFMSVNNESKAKPKVELVP